MNDRIQIGAAVLMGTLILAFLVARLLPTGRHRAPRTAEETVPLAELLAPREALVTDVAWCPAERAEQVHVFLALGGRVCCSCRGLTPHGALTSVPPAGGAR
ncbi:hypothetical protein [Streptomyces sp. NPDC057115]|uniref:hypothetical protein n=1 Tax=Streptomyces sp. NPDC057115 TaxID=3346022 RepID=UPI00364567D1